MSFQDMFPIDWVQGAFFFYCDVDINIPEQLDHAKHAGSIRGQANQCISTTETGSLERIEFILPG